VFVAPADEDVLCVDKTGTLQRIECRSRPEKDVPVNTSTATMHANQLRLYFSSVAYLLMHALRRSTLKNSWLTPNVKRFVETAQDRRSDSGYRRSCLVSHG
jgi:hypothetical protein